MPTTPVTLSSLEKVNHASIQRAGPRYTPTIDPNAPNLEIAPLVSAIESLALSPAYRKQLRILEKTLQTAWRKAPTDITSLFDKKTAAFELGSVLLRQLQKEKAGSSEKTLRRLRRLLHTIQSRIEPYALELYNQRATTDDTARNAAAARIYALQQFQQPVAELRDFIDAPDFALVRRNLLFLKGSWGTGKTHLLCDIVRTRTGRSLPTLFLLGQTLPRGIDPLTAACQVACLTRTPLQLLKALDRLGKRSRSRALLIIDGINEGDRSVWRRCMPSIIQRLDRFRNVALIISCRTPFDRQIMSLRSRAAFVEVTHVGFENIEFNAQKEFFKYYKIPTPHIPLLAPEFSRPLFLKILCETIASFTRNTRSKRINDFAAGHKSMTKLLEDFIVRIGKNIEDEYKLPRKSCWRLLKGEGSATSAVGLSVQMAEKGRDYVYRSEGLAITSTVTSLEGSNAEAFLSRLVTEGLLTEDAVFDGSNWRDVFRLPYQRFSDHLISRHLLGRYLKTDSEVAIRRSFYANRPLGKIFRQASWGSGYEKPGLASAVMLEFPERVKRKLPDDERELVFYLPRRTSRVGLIDAFVEGLLWRSTDSFCTQTDRIVSNLLEFGDRGAQEEMLEALVCLASRTGHPYSSERLYQYLSVQTLVDRDIFWSEFLRSRGPTSAAYRVLDWIISGQAAPIGEETATNLTWLCALFLTTTVRRLRDRATRCLVLLGQIHPKVLADAVTATWHFNDPYLRERMLAAFFGVLMRKWTAPQPELAAAAVGLATDLRCRLAGARQVAPIEHILMRDYSEGIIELATRLSPKSKASLSLVGLKISKKSVLPNGDKIPKRAVASASEAIHMDFDNYTTGRLVNNRANYDYEHAEYRKIQRQIRWRILNLGYDPKKFREIDREIGSLNFRMGRSDGGAKTDRYGKKYSWIAFYEVAGRLSLNGKLPNPSEARISDTDIDPSFPERPIEWRPPLHPLFEGRYRSPTVWLKSGPRPDYRHLLCCEKVDGAAGPWVLLQGYINEAASRDPREAFTFLRGLLVAPPDEDKLHSCLQDTEYPGNRAIPEPGSDHYLFAGEIGWSRKFGTYLRQKNGRAKPQLDEAFEKSETEIVEKPYNRLTRREKADLVIQGLRVLVGDEELHALNQTKMTRSPIVKLQKWVRIPGVTVELPSWQFAWESYHSEENRGGHPDYPAPSLVNSLRLRKIGASVDLVDQRGHRAMLYREFGEGIEGFRSSLLYLRRDLLDSYLQRRRRTLVWINWGERSLNYQEVERLRNSRGMRSVWQTHAQVHKQFISYERTVRQIGQRSSFVSASMASD